jgi:hypothetical protein
MRHMSVYNVFCLHFTPFKRWCSSTIPLLSSMTTLRSLLYISRSEQIHNSNREHTTYGSRYSRDKGVKIVTDVI